MTQPRRVLTVRARLTLWNVGVVALILIVLGIALRYIVSATLLASVDQQLQARADRFQRRVSASGTRPQSPSRRTADTPPEPDFPRLLSPSGVSLRPLGDTRDRPLILDRQAFTSALAGQERFSTVRVSGEKLRVYSATLRDGQGLVRGVVQVPFRLSDLHASLRTLDRTLLTLIPLGLLVAGIGGAFLTARALQPVRQMMDATDRITTENLSGRLPVRGRDEFAELAGRFNTMLARLEASFERLSRFTSDASHELRTPLAVIQATASVALEQPQSPERYRDALQTIDTAVTRSNRIVQDLLFLARNDNGTVPHHFAALPVGVLLDDVASLSFADTAPGPRLVVAPPPPDLTIRGDAHQLSRVLGNLVENARRHTPPDGQITVCAILDGSNVRITVTDTGEGIAPEHLPHVFERFYRVDSDRSRDRGGTGLGLAIAQSIVHAHSGTIEIASRLGEGTSVTVLLPGG